MPYASSALIFLITAATAFPGNSLTIQTPTTRIVYQRDNVNQANIPIVGNCPVEADHIEARLVAREQNQGTSTEWVALKTAPEKGKFQGAISGKGGWYDLEVRALSGKKPLNTVKLERVGVGEVFVIVGHSVAQGGEIDIEGAKDDRVSAISLIEEAPEFRKYKDTGDAQYLPTPVFEHARSSIKPAPFGHGCYFWSKFGELIAIKENVPVLIYNAAFGGTSMEHWAKSSQGILFEHSFVKAKIRMPYINLHNTLKKYIPLTGLRAVLGDQGANDAGNLNEPEVFGYYQIWLKQAREDLGYPDLAYVVNRQTPNSTETIVRKVQDRMVQEPNCFTGPDYDKFLPEDRYDGIHLSAIGATKAATFWAEALDENFFTKSKPWQPGFK